MIYSVTFIRIRNSLWLFLILFSEFAFSQGYNSTMLFGYFPIQYDKARATIDANSFNVNTEIRKMPFLGSTQGTIADINGNFLMSSNGVWIANANNDTMLNGSGLNPNSFTSGHPDGLTLPNGNIFLPMPSDSNKYILFHQTGNNVGLASTEIYYSIIDITLDGGLGEVISKNNVIINGSFGWGMSACKHGNGRDWWIAALSGDGTDVYKFLLTPDTIAFIGSQSFPFVSVTGWAGQPVFSPDGSKFGYQSGYGITGSFWYMDARILFFDRCTGVFSNPNVILTDTLPGFGCSFSPNSKYFYCSTSWHIYQINTDSLIMQNGLIVAANNDSFADPAPPNYTSFNLMNLAADGNIYLSTGNGTNYLHKIHQPDSNGISCDIQQHSIYLSCYHTQALPNHPNYYLGRKIGSPCDSLTGINEIAEHDFRFSISPNPSSGNFKIIYLLTQNKLGTLQIFDITGKEVYKQNLPQWSTFQLINLPKLSNGVYAVKISSDNFTATKKLLIQNE